MVKVAAFPLILPWLDGMKKAITVSVKQDNGGVGADNADWGFQWWDHLFNKASSSIQIEAADSGDIRVVKKLDETPSKPKLLYGSFVKSSGSADTKKDYSQPKTDEELLAACEGRRAGKGARVDQTGKLKRVTEYEKKHMSLKSDSSNDTPAKDGANTNILSGTRSTSTVSLKRKRPGEEDTKSKKKKEKKKKKKSKKKGRPDVEKITSNIPSKSDKPKKKKKEQS